jgi:3-hydroxyacyl-CoA dehydrogenase
MSGSEQTPAVRANPTELSSAFGKASDEAAAKARNYYASAERITDQLADIGPEITPRPVGRVGVIGAGTMGGGIAMNFLNVGLPVVLVETSTEALARGLATIRKNYERSAQKGKLTAADVEARMGLLAPTVELDQVASCDLVIEAVFENMAIKKELFARLDGIVQPGAILATNTSYLDVDEIAQSTRRPQDVIGLHFFSPANVMKLLEVVRGKTTDKAVVATSLAIARRIRKVPVVVGVCHGFVGNRMLAARRMQAFALIQEGAMPWDVDRVLEQFGMPMGPFAMTDLAGLDIGWSAETSRGDSILRDRLCELGRRGQKTGAGYYNYDPVSRERSVDSSVGALVTELARKSGSSQRVVTDQEILERCLYSSVNEGAKILDEGIARRASDIDVVWVNGYGWPLDRGGPMYWADGVGLHNVLAAVRRYEQSIGPDWRPADLLCRLVDQGRRFTT